MTCPIPWRLLGTLVLLAAASNTWAQAVGAAASQQEASTSAAAAGAQQTPATPPLPQAQAGYIDLIAGLAYTRNAFLTSARPLGSGIVVAGTTADYGYQGAEFNLDLLGTLEWVKYLRHSIPDEPYGQLTGTALLGSPTDLLEWRVSDGFGEQMANPVASPTPQALQWVNYLATGPDVNLNFALRDRLTVYGQYTRTTYQTSPFDSQGYDAGALFTHGISNVSTLSLLVSTAHTSFSQAAQLAGIPGTVDSYDIRAAALGYDAAFGRTQIAASAGYNTVSYPAARGAHYPAGSAGRPTGALQITHRVSPFASVFLRAQEAYESTGSELLSPPAGVAGAAAGATPAALTTVTSATEAATLTSVPGLAPAIGPIATAVVPLAGFGVVPGIAVAAPFEQRVGSIGWEFQHVRTGLSLAGTVLQQKFVQQSAFNLTAGIASASWLRQLSPTLSMQLQGFQSFYRFSQLHADNRATIASLSLSKQFSRTAFSAYAEWLHQRSSVPPGLLLPFALYSDELVGLSVSYDLVGRHSTSGQ